MKTTASSIELLESRIAPAMLNAAGTLLTYTDIDGDLVKVAFTGGAKMVASDFTFSTGGVDGTITAMQELREIELGGKTGGGFTLAATPQKIAGVLQGNSHANVETIDGDDTNLGTIAVDGDVVFLQAGNGADGTYGIKSFTALSLGQAGTGTSPYTLQNIGSFTVKTDIVGLRITFAGGVKSLTIGGNLTELPGRSTSLDITGNVGTLKIGGSIIGQDGNQSNLTISGGTVGTVTIGGSILGGSTDLGGGIAQVEINAPVKTFTLGGDLQGGAGRGGGSLDLASIGTLKIGGSMIGADNASYNGQVGITNDAQSVTIVGSIVGGDASTAEVSFNGAIHIGGNLGTFKLGHDFVGGARGGFSLVNTGMLSVSGTAGTVTIGGSIRGTASQAVYLTAGGGDLANGNIAAIKTLNVKGSALYASILAGYYNEGVAANPNAGFGSITIGGNLAGSYITFGSDRGVDNSPGTQDDHAFPDSTATVGSIKIGGNFSGIAGDSKTYYIYGPIIKKLTIGKASFTQPQIGLSFNAIGKATATSVIR